MRWLLSTLLFLSACSRPTTTDTSPPPDYDVGALSFRHDGGMKFGEQVPRFRVMNNGTFLPAYLRMNFVSGGCVDNSASGQIDCTLDISGGPVVVNDSQGTPKEGIALIGGSGGNGYVRADTSSGVADVSLYRS